MMNGDTMLGIGVLDRGQDVSLALGIASDKGPLLPGTYPAYHCGRDVLDCTDKGRLATLGPYPTGKPPAPERTSSAWLYPQLGLQPATVTIEWVKDVAWSGVGPAKRVKGRFGGTFAHLEQDPQGREHVVPPTHRVEGVFEVYAAIR